MVTVSTLLGSVVISVIVSTVLTYLLTTKQIKEIAIFRKKFDYFIAISNKLEDETQEYFLLIREIVFSGKDIKKIINEFITKLDFHEKNFGYNSLVLFNSENVQRAALEYFKTISKMRNYLEEYPKKKLDKIELLNWRTNMMEDMHKLLKALKTEIKV